MSRVVANAIVLAAGLRLSASNATGNPPQVYSIHIGWRLPSFRREPVVLSGPAIWLARMSHQARYCARMPNGTRLDADKAGVIADGAINPTARLGSV
jgi:hypothetical protein